MKERIENHVIETPAMPHADKRQSTPAFTLTELVIVMLIVAILAAIAVPRFGASFAHYRADAAAERIAADLALAQRQARTSSAGKTVEFRVDDNEYQLVGSRGLNRSNRSYIVDLSEAPYEAALVSADFDGGVEITFDGYGIPDKGGSVVVRAAREHRMITVNGATGEISVAPVVIIEDPDPETI